MLAHIPIWGGKTALSRYPFKVVSKGGKAAINIEIAGQEKVLTPEEITALVLGHMKETAERHLGQKVHNAVVTVPA